MATTSSSKPTREFIRQELVKWLLGFKDYEKGDFEDTTDLILEYGLDSMDGVEMACDLSARLGFEIPAKENPLVEDDVASGRRRPRKFGEVLDYLVGLAAK